MKYVDTIVKQEIDDSVESICSTGVTINYGTFKQHYIRTTVYQKLYGLKEKTLERYRTKVQTNHPSHDHKLYFRYIDGRYWYTTRMLKLRAYNKDRNTGPSEPSPKHIVNGNETHRSGIINWIRGMEWDYKCGCSYDRYVTFDECAKKMQLLHTRLAAFYPDATVSVFYATEANSGRDGHHNHFLVSIAGTGIKNKKSTLKRKIGSICGGILECKKYESAIGEDFIRYITKQLNQNPECTELLTHERQIDSGAI